VNGYLVIGLLIGVLLGLLIVRLVVWCHSSKDVVAQGVSDISVDEILGLCGR
jgi:uncharacterized membrane-anchored protein YhcB (DUF1043 family)